LKALITGATGLVGSRLLAEIEGAVVFSRDPEAARTRLGDAASAFAWAPGAGPAPAEAFAGVDVVFHLAGEPIASGRWTAAKKDRIRLSRVEGTRNLVAAMATLDDRPKVLVAASAVGYYGDRGDEELTEASSGGSDFLAEVCAAWEAESLKASDLGMRVVVARLGIVLAPDGGALGRMLGPFRKGLGGPLGNGRQWMPWVHIDDVAGLLLHAARTEAVSGPLNVVSPAPVPNKVFARALGSVLGKPAFFRAPRFGLRIAFGELSQVLLASQRVVPGVAAQSGYHFRYRELRPALEACIGGAEGG
jgi:uncharacterized protein (TIGR01777 family)